MDSEKREEISPIPDDLKQVLTEHQLRALSCIEGFGWDLRFVRRLKVEAPIPVVSDQSGKILGVLEPDGQLNFWHGLQIRP